MHATRSSTRRTSSKTSRRSISAIAVSNYRVEELARDVERVGREPGRRSRAREDDAAAKGVDRCATTRAIFFSGARDDCGSTAERLDAESRATRVTTHRMLTRGALDARRALVARARGAAKPTIALRRTTRPRTLRGARPAAPASCATICGSCCAPTTRTTCIFVEFRGRGIFLRASPIDVSAIVRELLLDRMRRDRADLGDADGRRRVRLHPRPPRHPTTPRKCGCRPSSTSRQQAILYLPQTDARSARRRSSRAAAGREVDRDPQAHAGPRVRPVHQLREAAAVQAIAAEMSCRLSDPRPGHRAAIGAAARFPTTPHAVLFATASFWQGVDVVGDALSCVIIDKLPFASPGDPITAARIEAINARGGEPFGEYQMPLAILALQQGLGRLIRHRQDRGVLAVLDPRLRTMGYGARFLASLPAAPVTQDIDAIERFFDHA